MDDNDKYCSSDPTGGCGSGSASLVAQISSSYSSISEKMESIDTKMGNISTEIEECCTETNANLVGIKDRLDTLITNAENCCSDIIDRLDTIAGLLSAPSVTTNQLQYGDYTCVQINV